MIIFIKHKKINLFYLLILQDYFLNFYSITHFIILCYHLNSQKHILLLIPFQYFITFKNLIIHLFVVNFNYENYFIEN